MKLFFFVLRLSHDDVASCTVRIEQRRSDIR